MNGTDLKTQGINRAIDNANLRCSNWKEIAYLFLVRFAESNESFMAEDVRKASANVVPQPPSQRAWGGVIHKAKKMNVIEHTGYSQVSNPAAHKANASVWRSLIFKSYGQMKMFA